MIYSLFMQSVFVDELGVIIDMIWLDLSYIGSVSCFWIVTVPFSCARTSIV